MAKDQFTRRSFLKRAAVFGGVTAAFPTVVPSTVFGQDAPSNKIVMGAIGTGSMGMGDLNGFLSKSGVRMVAVCDVDRGHREQAKRAVDGKYNDTNCTAYLDFRELIGRGDLDAVMTAVPDHWHAITSVAAAKAGLDIHGQKPLARSIREGRAICDAVHRYGRVWQTGSWQRSVANFRRACELVRNGRVGKVTYVEVGLPTGGARGPQPAKPVPDGMDWDFWLGPAPWRPYCDFGQGGCHYDWRWIMDYSGGQLTDWAGHHIDIAHWGMGMDDTGPVEIEGKGDYPSNGLYDVPSSYKFHCKYANGLDMVVANNQQIQQGAKWIGDKGWVQVSRSGLSASDDKILKEVIGPDEIQLYNSRDHLDNFLECVKSRKLTITPVETAQRSISVGLLGEIAMLTGRKIHWKPETEEIVGDPAASALLGRPYREPWTL